jgi:hypothetical protein
LVSGIAAFSFRLSSGQIIPVTFTVSTEPIYSVPKIISQFHK